MGPLFVLVAVLTVAGDDSNRLRTSILLLTVDAVDLGALRTDTTTDLVVGELRPDGDGSPPINFTS